MKDISIKVACFDQQFCILIYVRCKEFYFEIREIVMTLSSLNRWRCVNGLSLSSLLI